MHNKLYDNIKKFIKENLWFFISLFLIIFLFNFELPYYIEAPGGFISIDKRIEVSDGYNIDGEYGLAYVSMIKGSLPFLGYSFINNDWDIISKKDIKYDNETIKEMNEREKIYLNEALSNAKYVVLNYLNYNVSIDNISLYITYLDNDDTELKMLDKIVKINDIEVKSIDDIKSIINNYEDKYIYLDIIRNNKEMKVKSSINLIDGRKYIGVMITPNYDVISDKNININMKRNESGSSGGLMLSLSLYSKLSGEDLTKGDKIIGTGTIDNNGNVGEIAGVKYKLIGAVKNNAKVFLCPKNNYEEAINIVKSKNYNIDIVSVSTFEEAINYLRGR